MCKRIGLLVLGFALATGCSFDGGLNDNQQTPGNQDGGVQLAFGDIAVDATGTYFLSRTTDGVLRASIATGATQLLTGLSDPIRLAFGTAPWLQAQAPKSVVYLTMAQNGGELVAYDLGDERTLWRRPVPIETAVRPQGGVVKLPFIQPTEDDRGLLVTHETSIELISTADGSVEYERDYGRDIYDVDITPDGSTLLVTLIHDFDDEGVPRTEIHTVSLDDGAEDMIEVPNCADELTLAPNGQFAFLAPTTCNQDPVSVIDVESGVWLENLPGFGPVGLTPEGDVAVAFIDMENIDESLFESEDDLPNPAHGRYQIMLIDTADLSFQFLAWGDSLPRYALGPDGTVVLVDSPSWETSGQVHIVDLDDRTMHTVAGPDVRLENFVITSDSTRAFMLDDGLFRLSVPEREITSLRITFEPTNLNITPNDESLLLRADSDAIWVYDVVARQLVREISP